MRHTHCKLALLTLALALAPASAQEQGPSRLKQVEQLKQAVRKLEQESRRLRQQIQKLERSLPREEPASRPESRGRLRRVPELRDRIRDRLDHMRERMGDRLDDLRDHVENFEFELPEFDFQFPQLDLRLPDLKGPGAQSRSISVRRGPDGHWRVEVRSKDEDGQQKTDVYEADSFKEMRKKFPGIMKDLGLRLGQGGSVHLGPDSHFRFRFPTSRGPFLRGFRFPSTSPRRLGVAVQPLGEEQAEDLKGTFEGALQVREVESGSLARRLGIRPGDVILRIDGQRITSASDVARALGSRKAGATLSVQVVRKGQGKLTLKTRVSRRAGRIRSF